MTNKEIIKRLGRLLGYLERLDNEYLKQNILNEPYAVFIRKLIGETLSQLRYYNNELELKEDRDE